MMKQCDISVNCALRREGERILIEGQNSIDILDQFMDSLRINPVVVVNVPNPGLMTAERLENFIQRSLSKPHQMKIFLLAVNQAMNGAIESLYTLTSSQKKPKLPSKIAASACPDHEDATHYTLTEWVSKMKKLETKQTFSARIYGSQKMAWYKISLTKSALEKISYPGKIQWTME